MACKNHLDGYPWCNECSYNAQLNKSERNIMMGVGDGSGQLFVHGNYDSIKAAQKIVEERDELIKIVRNFTEAEYVNTVETTKRENTVLMKALSELTETVDSALLLDDELAQAWDDLYQGVIRARKVLDGVGIENE